jgi:hypothetical protein
VWFWLGERARLVARWQWFAAALLMAIVLSGAGFVFLLAHLTLRNWGDIVKLASGVLSVIGAFWVVAGSVGRFATLDSRRAAKTFLDTRTDPMEDLAEHFHWVLTQVGKPVMLLIDDLDRCPESHVVEVLETVQKLLRDRWTGTTSKLIILVAADGRWIRGSYDNTYATLANAVSDPGASIGSLFLQKLFQLTVPVPRLSNALREQYVEDLLAGRRDGVRRPGNTFLAAAIQQAGSGEQVLDLLASVSQGERIMVADEAIRRLVTDRQG